MEPEGPLSRSKPAPLGAKVDAFPTRRDQAQGGSQYLLPLVEAVGFYDHVHQDDVVAAGGHRQSGFPLLQVRSKKGSRSFHQRGVKEPLAATTNPAAKRKQFPAIYTRE